MQGSHVLRRFDATSILPCTGPSSWHCLRFKVSGAIYLCGIGIFGFKDLLEVPAVKLTTVVMKEAWVSIMSENGKNRWAMKWVDLINEDQEITSEMLADSSEPVKIFFDVPCRLSRDTNYVIAISFRNTEGLRMHGGEATDNFLLVYPGGDEVVLSFSDIPRSEITNFPGIRSVAYAQIPELLLCENCSI